MDGSPSTALEPTVKTDAQKVAEGLTEKQRHIICHSLGLRDDGRGKPYRSHFVTGEGSTDYPDCMALTELGLMVRRDGSPLTGGDDLFLVTDAGKAAAKTFRALLQEKAGD